MQFITACLHGQINLNWRLLEDARFRHLHAPSCPLLHLHILELLVLIHLIARTLVRRLHLRHG